MRTFFILILTALLLSNVLLNAEDKSLQLKPEQLIIDHIMFPVYNNDSFLDEIKIIWEEKGFGKVTREDYEQYSGVYLSTKNFYVEYLSTNKGDGWWRNKICIVLDKKYWDFYETPMLRDEHFLVPNYFSGYFIVSPDYPKLNSKDSSDIDFDGLTIYISEKLAEKLKCAAGKNWTLPSFVKIHKELVHENDIVVVENGKEEYIAPYLQSNIPWIFE